MYVLDYLIYHLKPYGIGRIFPIGITPAPPPDFELTATPWSGPTTIVQGLHLENLSKNNFIDVEES